MAESKNDLDLFERRVKESLEQFEVPYNSADWVQMERALAGGVRSWGGVRIGLLAALVGGALLVGTTAYLLVRDKAPDTDLSNGTPAAVPADTDRTVAAVAPVGGTPGTGTERPSTGGIYAATPAETTPVQEVHKAPAEVKAPVNAPAHSSGVAPAPASPGPSVSSDAAFRASVSEGCPGTPVEFKVERMPEDGIYLWNFGDGSFSNKPNPEHTYSKPGNYQVMLSMSSTGVGTIHNKPSSDMIVIHEAPRAAFNPMKQEFEGHIPSVHFENRTLGAKTYHWDFGDGATSAIAHPDHIYKKKGIYQVELTVTSELGCVDKSLKEVRIDRDYNLDAPTALSPNGDGMQETFMPEALRTLGVKFHLAIYDPNGSLVYETSDATKPWTGRPHNEGELCPAGEYVWVADVSESLHLAETYTGKVRLTR